MSQSQYFQGSFIKKYPLNVEWTQDNIEILQEFAEIMVNKNHDKSGFMYMIDENNEGYGELVYRIIKINDEYNEDFDDFADFYETQCRPFVEYTLYELCDKSIAIEEFIAWVMG